MPDSYSFADFQPAYAEAGFQNNPFSYNSEALGRDLGFEGETWGDLGTQSLQSIYGQGDGGPQMQMAADYGITPEFQQHLSQYSFTPTMDEGGNPAMNIYDKTGKLVEANRRVGDHTGSMMKFMGTAMPALVSAGFGAGLGGLFGGGAVGNTAGNMLSSGGMTAARGGNANQIGSSMFSSAMGGGLGAINPAGMMGLDGTLAKTVNAGIGGALGAATRGGNALQGGLSAMATTGLNNFGDIWNSFSGDGGDMEFDSLQGSGGDMSGQTDVSANTYDEASPDFRFGGDFAQTAQPGMKTAQSVEAPSMSSLSSFMPSGASVGNYLGSHGGDLAAMLYGFYNNKKQQRALQGQQQQAQTSLESLYGQNSPYAQQLRANLQAKAAQQGKRLNTSGRETQLQAMLADRSAQHQAALGPQMYQNQMGQNNLKNNQMNMLLQGANKLGAFKALGGGLQGMFGNSPVMQNSQPFQNYFGDYNSLSGAQ